PLTVLLVRVALVGAKKPPPSPKAVLPLTVLLVRNTPAEKIPPPRPPAVPWGRPATLARTDELFRTLTVVVRPSSAMPPPSNVARLRLTVLRASVTGPLWAKIPPPLPVARLPVTVLLSSAMVPVPAKMPPPDAAVLLRLTVLLDSVTFSTEVKMPPPPTRRAGPFSRVLLPV